MMKRVIIRRATLADENAISDLAFRAERRVLRIPWGNLHQVIEVHAERGLHDLFLGEGDGQLVCICGSSVGPDTVAQIRIFALRDDWPVCGTLAAVLTRVRGALREKNVKTLAFVGAEEWLLNGLMANGFRQVNTIVALQKTDFSIPDAGNRRVTVRRAHRSDFGAILGIDQAAFEPLWRNTVHTLTEYLKSCPYFVVSESDGEVVGYGCGHLNGRHGHLARIAVHPRYHGQRIGVRLLAEAIRFLHGRRALGVTLNTHQDNVRARRLYGWFGFKTLGKEADVLVYTLSCQSARNNV